ncbi:MAG: hypothetical protein V1816_13385 [Pseudomonadota bacterium]
MKKTAAVLSAFIVLAGAGQFLDPSTAAAMVHPGSEELKNEQKSNITDVPQVEPPDWKTAPPTTAPQIKVEPHDDAAPAAN